MRERNKNNIKKNNCIFYSMYININDSKFITIVEKIINVVETQGYLIWQLVRILLTNIQSKLIPK